MTETEPAAVYYRYDPADLPDGIYTHAILGELRPGRVVEVRQMHAYLVTSPDNPDWKKATKKEYEAQPPITEERNELRLPIDEED